MKLSKFFGWFRFLKRYRERKLLLHLGAAFAIELGKSRRLRRHIENNHESLNRRINWTFNKYGKKK